MEKIGIQPTACKDDPPAYQGLIKSLLMSSTPVISITFSANELWSVSWPIQALWDDLKNIPVFITLCCHRLMIAFFHRMAYWCTIPFGFWAARSPGFFWSEETQAWGPLFGKTVQVMSSDGSNLMLNVITGLFRAYLGLIICGLLMPYSLWFLGCAFPWIFAKWRNSSLGASFW